MPEERDEQRFKHEVVNSSELGYVRKMKHFYDSEFQELSKQIGQETEHKVIVTNNILEKVEERLSEFEKREKELIDNYRKCARKVEGVAI